MTQDAVISNCGLYRYTLGRYWSGEPIVAFVGLNPSTADASVDDNTIRRCIAFARSWDYGGLIMLNLFAFRSTQPKAMMSAPDPIGPLNDEYLVNASKTATGIIAAWGKDGAHLKRSGDVLKLLNRPVQCLGINKDGSPKHPLYLPSTSQPIIYPWTHA